MALEHRKILAVILILYGGIHTLVFAFFLLIVLAVSGWGAYYRLWATMGTLSMLGMPALVAASAIVAGYALARRRSWARVALVIAMVSALASAAVVWTIVSHPHLSVNRVAALGIYWVVCLAICLYLTWLLRRKALAGARTF